MAQSPRPLKQNRMKLLSVLLVSLLILLLDWFFMNYATTHGFDPKNQPVAVGGFSFQFPLQWLPVLGVLIVALVAWYEVSERIFPRRSGPESDPLGNIRTIRAIALSLAAFILILYLPYLLGSGWFWTRMSDASRNVSQLRDFGLSLLHTEEPVIRWTPIWQYAAAQLVATAGMVTVAWFFSRTPRRPRKLR